jgi:hypothetical protein
VKGWREFMIKYVPDADLHDTNYVNSYNSAMALEAVLKACGDDLSAENILKQAHAVKDLQLPMLLPGIKVNTSPTDHVPVDQMQSCVSTASRGIASASCRRGIEIWVGHSGMVPTGRRFCAAR